MFRSILLACLLGTGLATMAVAERRVALVLGVDDYKALRPLENPVNDARAMEDLLEAMGFEVWLETDRDQKRMRRALEDFAEDAAGADVALVFYAGHGVALDGVNYLLPTDADPTSAKALAESSVALEEVREVLVEAAPRAIILLDACRDDPFVTGGSEDGRGAKPLPGAEPVIEAEAPPLGRVGKADGVIFVFAAAPGATASDGSEDNSPFTAALVRNLGRSNVEVQEAITRVRMDVYDRTRGKQRPYLESGLNEVVYLAGDASLGAAPPPPPGGSSDPTAERDQLLLAMAKVPVDLQAEIEAVAMANDMPLAPLYAAVESADLAEQSPTERKRLLEEAAASYAGFRQWRQTAAASDPRVAELHAQAEELATLGSMDAARALVTEAAAIDEEAARTQWEDLDKQVASAIARTVSAANSHALNANIAQAELRYDLAIGDLTRSAELFATVADKLTLPETRTAYNAVLRDLGELLQKTGDTNGARGAFETRLDFVRAQVEREPLDFGWRRELVWSLGDVGAMLQQQGFLNEAEGVYLQAYEATSKQNIETPNDEGLMRDLARTLGELGDVQFRLLDMDGALLSYQEGLGLAQSLLLMRPDDRTYSLDVAQNFDRIGQVLVAMGDRSAAWDAFDLALDIVKKLSADHPEDLELRRQVAILYGRLGDAVQGEGDLETALAVYLEARKIYDDLMALDPRNVTRRSDSAVNYTRIGDIYLAMGDAGTALINQEAALAIRAELAGLDPSNVSWLGDLATSHEKIGITLQGQGQMDAALQAFGACRDQRLSIAARDPGNLPWQQDLARCVDLAARAQAEAGRTDEALATQQTALEIRRATANADPEDRAFQRDVAASLAEMARLDVLAGDTEAAVTAYGEAYDILNQLLVRDPSDALARYDLVSCSIALSDVQAARGDLVLASDYARQALTTGDKLISDRPDDPGYLHQRMIAASRLGEAMVAQQETKAAAEAFAAMVAAAEKLALATPHDISVAWNHASARLRLGEQKLILQDYPAARADLDVAVSLWKDMVRPDPTVVQTQRELAYALQQLADTYFHEGNLDPGAPLEEEALAIYRWVLQTSPQDTEFTLDLARALDRVASYHADPLPAIRESLGLLEGLQAQGVLPEGYLSWIENDRKRLGLE